MDPNQFGPTEGGARRDPESFHNAKQDTFDVPDRPVDPYVEVGQNLENVPSVRVNGGSGLSRTNPRRVSR